MPVINKIYEGTAGYPTAASSGYIFLFVSISAPVIRRPFDVSRYLWEWGIFLMIPCSRSFRRSLLVFPLCFFVSAFFENSSARISRFVKPFIRYFPCEMVSKSWNVSGSQTLKPVMVFPFTVLRLQILLISFSRLFTGMIFCRESRKRLLAAFDISA